MVICRSCAAPIEWAITEKGRRTPLNPEPVEDGNMILEVVAENRPPIARVVPPEERERLREEAEAEGRVLKLWISHFATCPHAEAHRRNRPPDASLVE